MDKKNITGTGFKQILKGWKSTDIGLIPEDWEVDVIDNHFVVKQGKQISQRTRQGNNQRKFLRTANVFWGKVDLTELDEMHFTIEEEDKLRLKYNDLLVCEGGDIGRTAIWRNDLKDCYYQNHIHRLRLKNDMVDPIFFMNWMYYGVSLSNKYFGIGNRTTIPNLSGSRLKAFQFPLPPPSEQKKIAHVLSKIQQAIETQEQIIKTTQELKKALMQKLFTEGLNGEPQKQTEIGLIPESWEVKRIDEVYIFTKKPRNRNLSNYKDIPFIPMELVPDSGIEANTFIPKKFFDIPSGTYFENGDLLLAKITPSFENGKQGIADINFIFGYATTEVIPIKQIENLSDILYLFYYLLKKDVRKILTGKMEGSTGRQRLPKGVVQATLIPFPKLSIQKKISSIVSKLDYKIEFGQRKVNNLKALFKSSLNNLMTGQIRVNDIEFIKTASMEKKEEAKIFPIKRTATSEFKRTVLAAEIVSQSLEDRLFNKTKFQKLLYLAEYAGELELVSNYHRDAAGPYDNQMMRSIESQFRKLKWFGNKKVGKEIKYFPLEKAGGHMKYYENYWGEHAHTINKLIELLNPFDYDRCAIIATLFAAWNDLIIGDNQLTEDLIIKEFYTWHPGKKKYPKARLQKALIWMREINLVPKGFGKPTFNKSDST